MDLRNTEADNVQRARLRCMVKRRLLVKLRVNWEKNIQPKMTQRSSELTDVLSE